ncbi:MAG: response regulator [Candidatus Omnitrophota bacterium]
MSKVVLVADDEKDTSDFLKRILERRGFKVLVSYDGVQAKLLLEANKFDVVLLDCNMPGITGPELIATARENNANTKVIVFSGYSAEDNSLISDFRADAFLQKPLTLEALEEVLK